MNQEEKIAALRRALDAFLEEARSLRQEHGTQINRILAAIDERKMADLRAQIENEKQ